MIYRIENGVLQTVKYIVYTSVDNDCYTLACSKAERDEILQYCSGATVEDLDNAGYEWLDGMTFTPEQIRAGEIERAIEMGEESYKEYAIATDRDAQMLDLDYRISLLELGIGGGEA